MGLRLWASRDVAWYKSHDLINQHMPTEQCVAVNLPRKKVMTFQCTVGCTPPKSSFKQKKSTYGVKYVPVRPYDHVPKFWKEKLVEFSVANYCHYVCTFLGAHSSTSILSVSAGSVFASLVQKLRRNFHNTKYDLMFSALWFPFSVLYHEFIQDHTASD